MFCTGEILLICADVDVLADLVLEVLDRRRARLERLVRRLHAVLPQPVVRGELADEVVDLVGLGLGVRVRVRVRAMAGLGLGLGRGLARVRLVVDLPLGPLDAAREQQHHLDHLLVLRERAAPSCPGPCPWAAP